MTTYWRSLRATIYAMTTTGVLLAFAVQQFDWPHLSTFASAFIGIGLAHIGPYRRGMAQAKQLEELQRKS